MFVIYRFLEAGGHLYDHYLELILVAHYLDTE